MRCSHAGKLVCRYLFRRCDNEPAPWSGAEAGDPAWAEDDLPDEATAEIARCSETVTYAGDAPAWDHDAAEGRWRWVREPPAPAAAKAGRKGGGGKSAVEAAAAEKRAVRSLHRSYSLVTSHQAACINVFHGWVCIL